MTKSKLERFAEMKTFPNVIEPSFQEIFQKDYQYKGFWSSRFFQNHQPLILELGCGKGEYTVNLAKENPDKNYLGIDIKGARMWKGAKKALAKGIDNAAFLRTRIDFIQSFFAEGEVESIWVTFPDPQPKKAKKRLISSKFLNTYRTFTTQDTLFHLKTDNTELFEYMKQLIEKNQLPVKNLSEDVHKTSEAALAPVRNIRTFYEQQLIDMDKSTKDVCFQIDHTNELEETDET